MFVKRLIPFFLFISVFLTYAITLSQSVFGGDSGDFASAIISGGIAHPPGYPLYLLLGSFFNALPLSTTPAWKIGLLSSTTSALTVVVMFFIVKLLTKSQAIALLSSLSLAFIYPFWLFGVIIEVFSLQLLFVATLTLFAICYIKEPRDSYLYLLSMIFGFSLAHHLSIIMIVPALIFAVLTHGLRRLIRIRVILYLSFMLLLGLLTYLYLPIASQKDSIMVWPKIDSFDSFLSYVLRKDYGWVDPNIGLYERLLSVESYFVYWVHQLPTVFIITTLLGVVKLMYVNRNIFLLCLLGFLLMGPGFFLFTGNVLNTEFIIGVLERFFVVSILFMVIFFSFGILLVSEQGVLLIKRLTPSLANRTYLLHLFQIVFFIIPFSLFFYNFPRTNLRNVWIGDFYARDILSTVPRNAFLFTQSDTSTFNISYLQKAFSFRRDVLHVSIRRSRELVDDNPLYASAYQKRSSALILSEKDRLLATMLSSPEKKPVFSDYSLGLHLKNEDINWEPYGLLVKKLEKNDPKISLSDFVKRQEDIFKTYHLVEMKVAVRAENTPLTLQEVPRKYADAYARTAEFIYYQYRDAYTSRIYFKKALDIDPDHALSLERLNELRGK